MIIATALIRGFKSEISNKIFGFGGHITIYDTNSQISAEQVPIDINQDFYPHLDTIGKVKYLIPKEPFFSWMESDEMEEKETKGGVRHMQMYAYKNGVIKTKKEIEGIMIKGVGKDFDWSAMKEFLKEGEIIEFSDSTTSKDIILSEQTSNRLSLRIGDAFNIYFVKNGDYVPRRFRLKGKYRTGLADFDKRIALVDIRQIQNLKGWSESEVGGFEVFVDDLEDLEPLTEYIYLERLPAKFFAESIKNKYYQIFDWLELTNTNEVVLISLMLLIAIINMITALLILILERTNMIGILKALGTTNWNIRKMFLYYAAYIVLLGLFWGNLIGLFICFLQDKFKFVPLSEEDYYLSYAPIEINWWVVIALNIGTLLVTLIFLIIPSYLVTRISPVKAIRFK